MIEIEVKVTVDGRSYGTDIRQPTVSGFNNAGEAIILLTKEIERIIAAIDASEETRKAKTLIWELFAK